MIPQSGFRAFSGFITSMSGVQSLRWSSRFVWVKRCEHDKEARVARRLIPDPQNMGAFKLADLIAGVSK